MQTGCIHSGSAQSVRRGLAQSCPKSEAGDSIPPSPARLRWTIPTGRRRLTEEGGAGEEAWTKRNPWVAVGWKEADHSSVSTTVVLGRWGNGGAGPVAGSRCSGNWSTSSGVLGRSCCRGQWGRRMVIEGCRREALGPEVIDGEGVDGVELRTPVVLPQVVVR
jgi:hypothetical protein